MGTSISFLDSYFIKKKKEYNFSVGDMIQVSFIIAREKKNRIQTFKGLCIAKSGSGITSSFIVRRLSHSVGVEMIFSIYSPNLTNVVVIKEGYVKRSKLYYFRDYKGKKMRVKYKSDKKFDNSKGSLISKPDVKIRYRDDYSLIYRKNK